MIFIYLYIFFMGFLMLFFPRKMWKLRHWFSVKNGEPSEGYLLYTRISGVLAWIVMAFLVYSYGL